MTLFVLQWKRAQIHKQIEPLCLAFSHSSTINAKEILNNHLLREVDRTISFEVLKTE